MFSHFFIDRPVFACVICLVITLLGAVSVPSLPVEQFPDIVPPTIMVIATYPGASAEDVANAVAIPLEEQLNGVDNMIYMDSQCTSDGSLRITVAFEVGTDPDIASVLVQNRVKMAEPLLPDEVRRLGIKVIKRVNNFVCFVNLIEKMQGDADGNNAVNNAGSKTPDSVQSSQPAVRGGISGAAAAAEEAEKKGTKSGPYLANYASLYLKDRLARVDGVGEVMVFDQRLFSMRVWLDEDAMAARGISVQEVYGVIQEQNVQVAAGRIGLEPVPEGVQTNLAVVTLGRLKEVSQFENLVLKVDELGGVLRLKDIATIELGAADYTTEARYNGRMATGMAIAPRAGANSLKVSANVVKLMESLKESIGRSGLEYKIPFNATDFVQATVDEFVETLCLCVLFVIFTVFIFLQDWRAALIPTLTIPVSIVGTFFLMWCFGFSINTMTLFGLILVIGIVVDDAIVVVENTQRIIDTEHLDGKAAAKKSMIQVMGPVVATVLVMMAVFLPTSMMQGIVGRLYKQFALTIAGSVGISGICGVTLAPALCAILLRPSIPKNRRKIWFRLFNFCFDGFAAVYLKTVKSMIYIAPVIFLLWCGLIYVLLWTVSTLPSGFLPNEDQGVIMMEVKLPEGASKERTAEILDRVEKLVRTQQTVNRSEDYYKRSLTTKIYERFWDKKKTYIESGGIKAAMYIGGFSFISGNGSNLGMVIMPLDTWKKRRDDGLRIPAIQARLQVGLNKIAEAQFQMITPPPIQGLGMATGISYVLLDERGVEPTVLASVMEDLKYKAVDADPIVAAMTPFNPNSPRLFLDIDRDKAKRMGLSLGEVFAALQSYLGTAYVNDFNVFGRTYRVNMQAKGEYRDNVQDVLRIKVKNNKGTMVPLEAFTTLRETSGPQLLTRYNMFPSAAFTGILRPDRSTSEGIAKMEELSRSLPDGFSYDWTGVTFQEKRVGNQTAIFFAVSVLFAFLILAAQYESWAAPLIIMMAVPLGVAGSLTAVVLFAMHAGNMPEINLYTQIGLLMMVGLSAKNAILITEFARERRESGVPLVQAAYEAGRLRLRPIFMTSFAFILGVLPLVWADGAGSNARNAIGDGVFGGLLMETFVGVYVTPVLFVLIMGIAEYFGKYINAFLDYSRAKAQRRSAELDEINLRRGD
ncbi:MAG: efflux RND transporter permease subunit [Planctomycetaceae bacterium]|jgi:HAE1 family hydrophobic/amphiphilic exporter-1|nr:efflux RND transporter permease subunit [Planctomycetaceae bacterium]